MFFSILIKGEHCSQKTADKVYEYIVSSRIKSTYPVFLIELYKDIKVVGNNISNKGCILKINRKGDVTSFDNIKLLP